MKELDYLEELERRLDWYESFIIGTYGEETEALKVVTGCKNAVLYDIELIKRATPNQSA